ncbi:MAG: family 10 glycosylhydrolase [Clostridia bacterium]|nr:family 10 glycosylhydrolase [Clostridia bacterium]
MQNIGMNGFMKLLNDKFFDFKKHISDFGSTSKKDSPENEPSKQKKKIFNKRVVALITASAVVAAICAFTAIKLGSDGADGGATGTPVFGDNVGTEEKIRVSHDEMRGVWIASVGNINYPSKTGLVAAQLAGEIDKILDECAKVGLNTVFFQVRPAGDALYKSEIYPWSQFVSGTQGVAPDGEFDSLAYMISKASEYGIKVHAWVNPYRVTTGSAQSPKHDVNALAETHPARLNPEYVIPYADGKLYFDPGNPEVRSLVISGIAELCEKYPELAGVHIDDYFYPYPVSGAEFDDSASYEKYGAGMEIGNWRRNNVNVFVKQAYDTVKGINPEMKFGVSPFGIWANNTSDTGTLVTGSVSSGLEAYFSLYCDALAWANGGYVDYIVPQDYWSFSTKAASFDNIARWWNANLDGTGVDLYIGHAAYKAADYPKNEIGIQVEFARSLVSYKGSVFYGFEDIKKNTAGVRDDIKRCFDEYVSVDGTVSKGGTTLRINYPTTKYTVNASGVIHGSSDPEKPVMVNGEKISRTADGFFSIYPSLEMGENKFTFVSGDEKVDFILERVTKLPSSGNAVAAEMKTFEIVTATPEKPMWLVPGDTVAVTCTAPSGSKVYAKFGSYTVEMTPTNYSATTSKNYKETYKGSITVDDIIANPGEIADIGVLTVYAEKNGKTATKTLSEIKQMGGDVKVYAEVKNDFTYFKRSPSSSFYGDPLSQSVGMRDYITAFVDGYYRLGCGYYVSEKDVNVVYDKALSENRITSATVKVTAEDTTNNQRNYTDLSFGVLENVPVDVKVEEGKIKVIFLNTNNYAYPAFVMSANPMVSEGTQYVENELLTYEFTLKNAENYYGFNVVYEDGFINVRLNNPQTVKAGDKPLSGKMVVIDPGHGGTDKGALGPSKVGSSLHEADLNLGISLELCKALEEMGATVIMTREDDSTLPLEERARLICEIIPDFLISVHHNSVADTTNSTKARGYLGLYGNPAGLLLASSVSDVVSDELSRFQRATAKQSLAVLRSHRFPGTLCEMSFISYAEEFQWTITPGNFERSAKAIANGVLEFYERQEKYLKY